MIRAYVNFALIKYWGKKDEALKLPNQASLSFTVDKLYTDTLVTFNESLKEDIVIINGIVNDPKMSQRVIKHMDYIRSLYNIKTYAKIESINNVPTKAGLASSASSFAALTKAAINALGINISDNELSRIARIGSGSASRSIYGDFVIWNTGDDATSVASKLNLKWDDFRIIVCLVSKDTKKVGSGSAMKKSVTLPSYENWVIESKLDLDNMLIALNNKDIDSVGVIAEKNANHMHDLIEETGVTYRTKDSFDVIKRIKKLRDNNIKAYYTMDAGPNVKIITTSNYVDEILKEFNDLETIVCKSGKDIEII